MTLRRLLLALALCLPAPAAGAAQSPVHPVKATVTVTRLAAGRWRVDYAFGTPVSGILFGPPVAGCRARAWRPAAAGVRLDTLEGSEALVAERGAVSRMSVEIGRHSAFDHGRYAPQIPFTDGGAALFLRHLAGRPIVDGSTVDADVDFRFAGLAGERVIRPEGGSLEQYVYFGPARPDASAHARLILDPGAPAWVRAALGRVIEETSRVYDERLGRNPGEPPLVFIGMGDVDSAEGLSVKGDAVGGQFAMLLTGRGLREETPKRRAALERLAAHELAHLWQIRSLPRGFDHERPWLHEGGAEAMAVYALGASGVWDPAQVAEFAAAAKERCATALGGKTLAEAAKE
jgi:hypothetical protein